MRAENSRENDSEVKSLSKPNVLFTQLSSDNRKIVSWKNSARFNVGGDLNSVLSEPPNVDRMIKNTYERLQNAVISSVYVGLCISDHAEREKILSIISCNIKLLSRAQYKYGQHNALKIASM